ncbi:peroxisomal abc transporter [Colletotrichum asianum]
MISASKDLESLAASFIVDAEDFLYPFRPRDDLDPADQRAGIQDSWDCLETLALTSQTLSARQSRSKVNDLLHAAANAARRMPKLRVLEIWYGQGTEEGCIFRYNRNGGNVTWQSTWSFEFAPRVLSSWAEAIEQHSGDRFAYCDMPKVEEMGLSGTYFPASVLRSLWLKDLAVHRVSLRQLEIMGDQP